MKTKQIAVLVISLTLGASVNGPLIDGAIASENEAKTVISGLNGPMGVWVTSDGYVWVVDTGVGGDEKVELINPGTGQMSEYSFGESSQIIRLDPEGGQVKVASLPSLFVGPGEGAGGARLVVLDGTVFATVGAFSEDPPLLMASVVRIDDGQAVQFANIWEFESTRNPDGLVLESNPYALTVGPDRNLWMTDAAGNSLMKIDPETGQMELVAVFDGVASPIPHPNRGEALETDPVPTGVAFDGEGNAYVSF